MTAMPRRWISSRSPQSRRITFLVRWVDLPLTETDALNMGSFAYLANYDAYYHFHGDTNAPGDVCFYAGERSSDTVTLYYQPEQCGVHLADTAGSGEEVWAKVTVEPQKDGGFHILSNQLCHRPDGLLGESRPLTGRGAGLLQHGVLQQRNS